MQNFAFNILKYSQRYNSNPDPGCRARHDNFPHPSSAGPSSFTGLFSARNYFSLKY